MPLLVPFYDPANNSLHEVEADAPQWTLPVVAIDECANNGPIGDLTRTLIRQDFASMTTPVWQQLHEREDGGMTNFYGSSDHQTRQRFDLGKPVKGQSFSDRHVTWVLLGHFASSDTLVLISENRKLDATGIRRTLEEVVAPALRRPHFARLSLTMLARQHTTSWEDFANLALDLFRRRDFSRGYNYIEL